MDKSELLVYEEANAKQFWADAGNYYLVHHFDLNENSHVIDVGGYKGDWTAYVTKTYRSFVAVFEPMPNFYRYLVTRFSDNYKVKAFNFGLEGKNCDARIAVMEDSSSLYYPLRDDAPTVEMRDASEIVKEFGVVDLMAINGEGCEYNVLMRLIETDQIRLIRNLLIQFHAFYPRAEELRHQIRGYLRGTHMERFEYPFVWEGWSARSPKL